MKLEIIRLLGVGLELVLGLIRGGDQSRAEELLGLLASIAQRAPELAPQIAADSREADDAFESGDVEAFLDLARRWRDAVEDDFAAIRDTEITQS